MSYSYDNSSELTGITYTNGGTTLGTLTYGYDLARRRTSLGGSYARIALPLGVSEAEYNANNQLTEWGTASLFYDANGNMISDGVNSYTWNARNQLASMNFGANSFQYDAYGRRVSKTISSTATNYLNDGANIVQELSGTTPTANLLSGGIDEVFTRTDSNGTANFLTDALGSAINLTDSSANSLAQYAYEPFGNTFVTSGSSTNTFQYTGRENDGTGLYFYRARYYNPILQRFISQDPAGYTGGINSYIYALASPIDFSDPLGLWTFNGGVSFGIQAGPVSFQFSGGIVFDSHGNMGTYFHGGGGPGVGTGVSSGVSFGGSNAPTIMDLGQTFAYRSAGGGTGVGGSIDQFHGLSPITRQPVSGGGVTLGPTVGGGASAGLSYTKIFPIICVTDSCGPAGLPNPGGSGPGGFPNPGGAGGAGGGGLPGTVGPSGGGGGGGGGMPGRK